MMDGSHIHQHLQPFCLPLPPLQILPNPVCKLRTGGMNEEISRRASLATYLRAGFQLFLNTALVAGCRVFFFSEKTLTPPAYCQQPCVFIPWLMLWNGGCLGAALCHMSKFFQKTDTLSGKTLGSAAWQTGACLEPITTSKCVLVFFMVINWQRYATLLFPTAVVEHLYADTDHNVKQCLQMTTSGDGWGGKGGRGGGHLLI